MLTDGQELSDPHGITLPMNKLTRDERIKVLKQLLEGSSVSSTVRLTDVSMPAILKLLVDVGSVCADAHDRLVRNLKTDRVECDELWAFINRKNKNASEEDKARGEGDSWTWIGIDAESKLIISYLVADRSPDSASQFIGDLSARLANRVQISTDGLHAYVGAIGEWFGEEVDFAQIIKQYGNTPEGEKRYSPATCTGVKKVAVTGNPDSKLMSTSYVERTNLTVRTTDRRFTRLTCAFSKKWANHVASVQLHFFAFNFIRVHRTLRMTPAMAAGITDRLWTVADIVDMLEAKEAAEQSAKPARGPRDYKALPLTPIKVKN